MAAKIVNIELDAGSTTKVEYDWTDPSTNLPINLTGYTAHMQIRANPYEVPVLLDYTSANNKITLGGAAGTIILNFAPADTNLANWSRATYDLYITNTGGDGSVTAVARGMITLLAQTTQ